MTVVEERPADKTSPVADHLRMVTVKVRRYDPEVDPEANWQSYEVPVEKGDRLLDALHQIKWYQDGSLTFRRSCAHGVCGSDAMRINGVNRLACKVLVKDLGDEILVEPIKGLPVLKDLVVDMEPFFEAFRSIKPFLITDGRVFWNDEAYFGPQAIVMAHRFIFDSRDDGAEERLEILNDREGVWRCRTTFNCTDACPRGIQVTKAIQEVKRALIFRRI
jgi:succinate dehydrogenase / fumarate reductase iron-sulfur subunit